MQQGRLINSLTGGEEWLLFNDVFFYLLLRQHEIKKVNYRQLAQELGLDRGTIARKYKIIEDAELISKDENGMLVVKDDFN